MQIIIIIANHIGALIFYTLTPNFYTFFDKIF